LKQWRQCSETVLCLRDQLIARGYAKAGRPGLPDFFAETTKAGKIYQITIKYIKSRKILPDAHQIDQMAVKYTNIFHGKTLQNLPKLRILV
jgi:hypothetical protein